MIVVTCAVRTQKYSGPFHNWWYGNTIECKQSLTREGRCQFSVLGSSGRSLKLCEGELGTYAMVGKLQVRDECIAVDVRMVAFSSRERGEDLVYLCGICITLSDATF